jgi:histidinol-phosphatase
MTPSVYLSVALEAVKEAEKVINHYYQQEVRASLKADQSPVTIADQKAEEIIRSHIKRSFPNHGIWGEEAGKDNETAEYCWIIDPIDGTKNYLRKIPLFATQLALMHKDEVILGVSNAPAMGELIYAEKDQGSYLNGQLIGVSKINALREAYLSYGGLSYFVRNNLLESFLKLEGDTHGHRGIGDAWSYHLLVQGKIDIMIEASVKIWDIAAVKIIVEEAGGTFTDLYGKPFDKTTTTVMATNGLLHPEVIPYFQ